MFSRGTEMKHRPEMGCCFQENVFMLIISCCNLILESYLEPFQTSMIKLFEKIDA